MIMPAENSHQVLSVQQGLHERHILIIVCEHRLGVALARCIALLCERIVGIDPRLCVGVNAFLLKCQECVYGDMNEG